ncbi:MAG: hypothetical protein L0Y77_09270 [Chlorobi bacterium]|nr:hypothetical protein [Chlorobiota bacterium]
MQPKFIRFLTCRTLFYSKQKKLAVFLTQLYIMPDLGHGFFSAVYFFAENSSKSKCGFAQLKTFNHSTRFAILQYSYTIYWDSRLGE